MKKPIISYERRVFINVDCVSSAALRLHIQTLHLRRELDREMIKFLKRINFL